VRLTTPGKLRRAPSGRIVGQVRAGPGSMRLNLARLVFSQYCQRFWQGGVLQVRIISLNRGCPEAHAPISPSGVGAQMERRQSPWSTGSWRLGRWHRPLAVREVVGQSWLSYRGWLLRVERALPVPASPGTLACPPRVYGPWPSTPTSAGHGRHLIGSQ